MEKIEIITRQLEREKKARKEAEEIAENKSRVLYEKNLELVDKEKRTKAILETTADGIIVLDEGHNIKMFNQSSCQLFGYSSSELLEKKINDLLTPESIAILNKAIKTVLANKSKDVLYELEGVSKNNMSLSLELAISRLDLTEESLIICSFRNVFTRKQEEQRLALRHAIANLLAESASLDQIAYQILNIMCNTMQLDFSAMWKVDHLNQVLQCSVVWTKEDKKVKKFGEISQNFTFPYGIGLPGRVWKSKTPCWVQDVVIDTNFPRAPYANEAGLHTAFAIPILYEGEVLGILEFFTNKTYPYNKSIINMIYDITNQIGIFIEHEESNKRIRTLSRLAGMAEVASNVLHNVGNSLNSINISSELIHEKIKHSQMKNLILLVDLLKQNKTNVTEFITSKGNKLDIIDFLDQLSKEWEKEKKYLMNELHLLIKNIHHVKKIIMTQQSISRASGITEEVNVSDLLNEVLYLNNLTPEYENINVICQYEPIQRVIIDRIKLFQIVDNLVKNAIDALMESHQPRQLTMQLKQHDEAHFMIKVVDNGIGIKEGNITNIFAHGYTTKKSGHGFGLHSSAIYTKELGGTISAESQGKGQGATFTLIFPYQPLGHKEITNEI